MFIGGHNMANINALKGDDFYDWSKAELEISRFQLAPYLGEGALSRSVFDIGIKPNFPSLPQQILGVELPEN